MKIIYILIISFLLTACNTVESIGQQPNIRNHQQNTVKQQKNSYMIFAVYHLYFLKDLLGISFQGHIELLQPMFYGKAKEEFINLVNFVPGSGRKRKERYDSFRNSLIKEDVIFREGRIQKLKIDEEFVFKQKGVDTLMTMDLLKIAQSKEVNKIVLITSDTDFVPIIKDVRKNYKLNVILAYFTDRKRKSPFSLSNHLWKVVDEKILIKKKYFA